jgi:hypothetical protein
MEWTPVFKEKSVEGSILNNVTSVIGKAAASVSNTSTTKKKPAALDSIQFSQKQEALLLRCFNMFDIDEDGISSEHQLLLF